MRVSSTTPLGAIRPTRSPCLIIEGLIRRREVARGVDACALVAADAKSNASHLPKCRLSIESNHIVAKKMQGHEMRPAFFASPVQAG